MVYLVAQILICLFFTAMVGAVVGWLLRGMGMQARLSARDAQWRASVARHERDGAVPQDETVETLRTRIAGLQVSARRQEARLQASAQRLEDKDALIGRLRDRLENTSGSGAARAMPARQTVAGRETRPEAGKERSDRPERQRAAIPAAPGPGREGPARTAVPPGKKPAGLYALAPANADDLKLIHGIGPVLERHLNQLGIYRFAQVASLEPANLEWLGAHKQRFPERIARDRWIEQARALVAREPSVAVHSAAGNAAKTTALRLSVDGLTDGQWLHPRHAFAVPDPEHHVRQGPNRNPRISWTGLPEGAKSLVLICVDSDAPTIADDVNKAGREVPADLPRADFYHWVMVDIPPAAAEIAEGACSNGITAGGKWDPAGPAGSRQGANDYGAWFEGNARMAGVYLGYDGPCPPWNDALVHRYRFRLYATDLTRCPVGGRFAGPHVEAALAGHILAQAQVTGTYTLNPALRSPHPR